MNFKKEGRPMMKQIYVLPTSLLFILFLSFVLNPLHEVHAQSLFSARLDFYAGYEPRSVAIGDFDEDGYQDLATAIQLGASVSILLGNGDGTFQTALSYDAGSYPEFVAIGDFDEDGHQDLAVANNWSNDVSILLGNGDGTF